MSTRADGPPRAETDGPTRTHEPEHSLYYEQGYWRGEDMWQDFSARVARAARTSRR